MGEEHGILQARSFLLFLFLVLNPAPPARADAAVERGIELFAGWNLISLPVQPVDPDIRSVLSTVEGKYDAVYAWNNSTGKYEKYLPAQGGDLNRMVAGRGYWIHMVAQGRLLVKGTVATGAIELVPGWNLVGYNSPILQKPGDRLASLDGKYAVLWTWSAAESTPRYKGYAPPALSDLNWLRPGDGYWIYAREKTTWEMPPCPLKGIDLQVRDNRPVSGATPEVEIEVASAGKFPVGALDLVLQIGAREFTRGRFKSGDTDRYVFELSTSEFEQGVEEGEPVLVKYGQAGRILPPAAACGSPRVWYFGPFSRGG